MLFNKAVGFPLNTENFFCNDVAKSYLEIQLSHKKNILFLLFKSLPTLYKCNEWNSLNDTINWTNFCYEASNTMMCCNFAQCLTSPYVFTLIILINIYLKKIKSHLPTNDNNMNMDNLKLSLYNCIVNLYRLWHCGHFNINKISYCSNNFFMSLNNIYSLKRLYKFLFTHHYNKGNVSVRRPVKDTKIPKLLLSKLAIKNHKAESIKKDMNSPIENLNYHDENDLNLNNKIENIIEKHKNHIIKTITPLHRHHKNSNDKINNLFYSELCKENNIYDQIFIHHLIFSICPAMDCNMIHCYNNNNNDDNSHLNLYKSWKLNFFNKETVKTFYDNYIAFIINSYEMLKSKNQTSNNNDDDNNTTTMINQT